MKLSVAILALALVGSAQHEDSDGRAIVSASRKEISTCVRPWLELACERRGYAHENLVFDYARPKLSVELLDSSGKPVEFGATTAEATVSCVRKALAPTLGSGPAKWRASLALEAKCSGDPELGDQ